MNESNNDRISWAQTCLLWNPLILHKVLIQLPVVDLLFAQHVCRVWRDTICRSNSLQVALFMQPHYSELESEQDTSRAAESPPVVPNPLLKAHFPAFFDDLSYNDDSSISELGPFRSMKWNLGAYKDPVLERQNAISGIPESQRVFNTKAAAYASVSASWRRMVPYFPAPPELQVIYNRRVWTTVNSTFRKKTFYPKPQHPQSTSDQDHTDQGENESLQDAAFSIPPYSYLTFGLIYDITYNYWLMGCESELWYKFMHNGICRDIPKILARDLVWAPWTDNPDIYANNIRKAQIFEAYFKDVLSLAKSHQSPCVLHLGWLGFNLPDDKSDVISHEFSTLQLRSEAASRLDAWCYWWDTEVEFSTEMLAHQVTI